MSSHAQQSLTRAYVKAISFAIETLVRSDFKYGRSVENVDFSATLRFSKSIIVPKLKYTITHTIYLVSVLLPRLFLGRTRTTSTSTSFSAPIRTVSCRRTPRAANCSSTPLDRNKIRSSMEPSPLSVRPSARTALEQKGVY